MFKLLNINKVNTHLAIHIESPAGDITELTIGHMISKRNKEELTPDNQFLLLNAYLDYKGIDFKSLLYANIVDATHSVEDSGFTKGLSNPPTAAIHKILDMFDMVDVKHYIRDIYGIIPPANLKLEFDTKIESDGLGTRVQTYIQDDYFDLAALTLPVKAVIGILGQYALRKERVMSQVHREYILYNMLATHPVMNTPAIDKLQKWACVLIDLTIQDTDTASVTIIEKQIPSSELPSYILGVVVMQKLSIAAIVTDNRERNVITRIYNYIINKLKTKGGASSKIRDKKPLSDTDSASGDKDSIIESYRVVSNLTIGTEAEMNFYTNDMNMLIRDVNQHIDIKLLTKVHKLNQCFKKVPIAREQVIVAGYIFKDLLDPRSLDYINIDGIINIISLGFVMLWETGHRDIALVMCAKQLPNVSGDVDINVTPNIRLEPDLKRKLAILYPYEKQVNKLKTDSIVESAITDLTYNIFKHSWLPNSPEQCLKDHFGDRPPKILIPGIKNHLARLIIYLEESSNESTIQQ